VGPLLAAPGCQVSVRGSRAGPDGAMAEERFERTEGCGALADVDVFTCQDQKSRRARCEDGWLVAQDCPHGCLTQQIGGDDVCSPAANAWTCTAVAGSTPAADGHDYLTASGRPYWAAGTPYRDSGDNCYPACMDDVVAAGLCPPGDGADCEYALQWFAADSARFGCLARLKVTNEINGRQVVVVVID